MLPARSVAVATIEMESPVFAAAFAGAQAAVVALIVRGLHRIGSRALTDRTLVAIAIAAFAASAAGLVFAVPLLAGAVAYPLARRGYAEGEGLVIADIEIGRVPPSESIPDDVAAWTPEVAAQMQTGWATSGAAGRAVYVKTTRPRRNG